MKDKVGSKNPSEAKKKFSKKTRDEAAKKLDIYKGSRNTAVPKTPHLQPEFDTKRTSAQEIIQSILYEHKREKKHYGAELHNTLEQILFTLNIYVDALKSAKKVDEKLFIEYLDKVKELSRKALKVSHETAESLISDQIVEVGLHRSIQNLLDSLSSNHRIKIISKFSPNFDGIELDISKKHEAFKITKLLLLYIISLKNKGVIKIAYSFKYESILQIEITQKGNNINIKDLESYQVSGYNNLKHQIELFHARVFLNKRLVLVVKIPIYRLTIK